MLKKILILAKILFTLLIILAGCKGKGSMNVEHEVDSEKVDYSKEKGCYYFKYKSIVTRTNYERTMEGYEKGHDYILPVYQGLSKSIRYGTLYDYVSEKYQNRSMLERFCLDGKKGYYQTIKEVLELYKRTTFPDINLNKYAFENSQNFYTIIFFFNDKKLITEYNKDGGANIAFMIEQKNLGDKIKNGYVVPGMKKPINFEDLKRLDKEFYKVDIFTYEINGL